MSTRTAAEKRIFWRRVRLAFFALLALLFVAAVSA